MTLGDEDKGITRSEWWLNKIYSLMISSETVSSYNLPDNTVENTLLEIDDSNLQRLDAVWLDFVAMSENVTIKVYTKIDDINYRQYDSFSWTTSDENGVLLSPVAINGNWKITITSATAQGSIKTIPYTVIKTAME